MFRMRYRFCDQFSYFFNSLGRSRSEKLVLSCTVLSKSVHFFKRPLVFQPAYFHRQFKILSCVGKEEQPDGEEEVKMVTSMTTSLPGNPDDACMDKSTKNSKLNNSVPSASDEVTYTHEFLGIEVFPEIYDRLPSKCTGCGAILQSDLESKPGFIPRNRNPMLSQTNEENAFMAEIICSRCFNLKHYNKDTLPMVPPEIITNFLKHISRRKALILYNIDIMDIPGSCVPDILQLVGKTKHVILVCNKVDKLVVDGHPQKQIEKIKMVISGEAVKYGLLNANIRDVCVVSAKTGFGIDGLVKTILKHWKENSDIYIVGSNNSGKTTLFNLFVDLFSASRQSENMLQRGTVSSSAGTTLSLLRYPVTFHRLLRLQERLRHGFAEEKDKTKLKEIQVDEDIVEREMTKYGQPNHVKTAKDDLSNMALWKPQIVVRDDKSSLNWLFDTPGVYSKNQITHLLTNEELKLLNPSLWLLPRTVILTPGKVLFIGGLARLDYLDVQRPSRSVHEENKDVPKASQSIFFTVFASPNLPIHVTSLEKADKVYKEHVGKELFKVPCGSKERLERFPVLLGHEMETTGVDWEQSAADVILSNIGWVAVTAGTGSIVSVKAYTPNGVGVFLRTPSMLPTSVRQRGCRGVPYLGHVNHTMYQGTRKRSPSLVKILAKVDSGITQWMRVAEKRRKQQRSLIKFEKMKWHSLKKLGFSAKSNPTKFLDDYEGFQELGEEISKKNMVKLPGNQGHKEIAG